ncbi:MAG: hypothetical protein L0G99_12985 [Propionibacteriales bacterium]|nr:hypothetical protein [Propionibacteriales bacterium]
MNQQPPFGTDADLFAADPYPLAASALDLFNDTQIGQQRLQQWLRALVAGQVGNSLGLFGGSVHLRAVEQRVLLIWEHALVASRMQGRVIDTATRNEFVLLLDPDIVSLPYEQRLARLQPQHQRHDLR